MKITAIVSVLALVATEAAIATRNCTTSDLAGSYNNFRFTGSLGTYAPGTNQVVSYDHPVDSPVTGVTDIHILALTNDTICDDNESDVEDAVSPIIIAGLPALFTGETSDKSGSIELRLPVELPTGEYTFLLTITTSTDKCHLHSDTFTSNGQAVIDTCNAGESRCLDTSNFVECVLDTDSTTNGTFTGTTQTCSAGTSCLQNEGTALCTAGSSGPVVNPNPSGDCAIPGSMRCVNETTWEQCVQVGDQWAWSDDSQSCTPGTTCGVYQSDYIICQ